MPENDELMELNDTQESSAMDIPEEICEQPGEEINEDIVEETAEETVEETAEEMAEAVTEDLPEPSSNQQPEKKDKMTKQSLWKDFREIAVILMVFMLVYVLFFRVVVVVGDSMNHTLVDGDRLLLISGLLYRQPEQGDIIVASKDTFKDGEPIIKRVIATEGQTVDIDFTTGEVFVDGIKLEEFYISSPTVSSGGTKFPLTVPEGCVFVMGDNRINSLDSRSTQIGLIDEREILGKAVFLVFPGSDDDHSFELGRIGALNDAG